MRLARRAGLTGIVRALDAEGIAIEHLELHQPTLDDVFLAKTGRSLEGATRGRRGGAAADAGDEPAGGDPVDRSTSSAASVVRDAAPAGERGPAAALPARAARRERRRARSRRPSSPGFPTDSILAFLLAVPFIQGALFATMNTGTDLARDIQTGFMNRLSLTPMRDLALLSASSAARRARPLPGASSTSSSGSSPGVALRVRAARDPRAARLHRPRLARVRRARPVRCAPHGLGRGRCRRSSRCSSSSSSSRRCAPAEPDDVDWFRYVATANPVSYLIECVRSLIIVGWDAQALALGFGIARCSPRRDCARGAALRPDDETDVRRAGVVVGRRVADAEERPHEPAAPIPSIAFPLFFFTAFAGGLRRFANARVRLPARLHRVPVRLRAAPVGGVRRRLHGLRDRPRLRGRVRAAAAARVLAPQRDRARLRARGARALAARRRRPDGRRVRRGMQVGGSAVDLFGLYGLALLVNFCGFLWAGGHRDAVPVDAGGAAHADAGLPRPLLRAGVRAARAARRLDPRGRGGEPATYLLEAGRGFVAGDAPTSSRPSRSRSGSASLFWVWAFLGLRKAEAGRRVALLVEHAEERRRRPAGRTASPRPRAAAPGLVDAERASVRAVGGHRVEASHDEDDPRLDRDRSPARRSG